MWRAGLAHLDGLWSFALTGWTAALRSWTLLAIEAADFADNAWLFLSRKLRLTRSARFGHAERSVTHWKLALGCPRQPRPKQDRSFGRLGRRLQGATKGHC